MVDEISRGLVSTPMETLDQFITGEVTNHLFEDRRIPFSGIDLIALNIQRSTLGNDCFFFLIYYFQVAIMECLPTTIIGLCATCSAPPLSKI